MRQGTPVGDVSELEIIGTRIEAAGLEITKGDICSRGGRQKVEGKRMKESCGYQGM